MVDPFDALNNMLEDEDKDFQNVKDFIEENPTSNLVEITDGTGVRERTINKWVREGRIEIMTKIKPPKRDVMKEIEKEAENMRKEMGSGQEKTTMFVYDKKHQK